MNSRRSFLGLLGGGAVITTGGVVAADLAAAPAPVIAIMKREPGLKLSEAQAAYNYYRSRCVDIAQRSGNYGFIADDAPAPA